VWKASVGLGPLGKKKKRKPHRSIFPKKRKQKGKGGKMRKKGFPRRAKKKHEIKREPPFTLGGDATMEKERDHTTTKEIDSFS